MENCLQIPAHFPAFSYSKRDFSVFFNESFFSFGKICSLKVTPSALFPTICNLSRYVTQMRTLPPSNSFMWLPLRLRGHWERREEDTSVLILRRASDIHLDASQSLWPWTHSSSGCLLWIFTGHTLLTAMDAGEAHLLTPELLAMDECWEGVWSPAVDRMFWKKHDLSHPN